MLDYSNVIFENLTLIEYFFFGGYKIWALSFFCLCASQPVMIQTLLLTHTHTEHKIRNDMTVYK